MPFTWRPRHSVLCIQRLAWISSRLNIALVFHCDADDFVRGGYTSQDLNPTILADTGGLASGVLLQIKLRGVGDESF